MDIKDYKLPPKFVGCDFVNVKMPDGTVLKAEGEPVVLNNQNIVFPADWGEFRCAEFRRNQELRGWPGERRGH